MKWFVLALILCLTPLRAQADSALISQVMDSHILPRFLTLKTTTQALADTVAQSCDATSPDVQKRYHDAFDAWVVVSHLRFGPTEAEDRAFAIAFWPDTRGKTPKALRSLITSEDAVVQDPNSFRDVSIAARGFYAMEYLLFDEQINQLGSETYRCSLLQAIATDTANMSAQIHADWVDGYADVLRSAGHNGRYKSEAEGMAELFKAVITGYQFTKDVRLGRPIGTFDKPRPKRAEAWRSGRSLRHVEIATHSATDLAVLLSGDTQQLTDRYKVLSDYFDETISEVSDPTFASVANIQRRNRVEGVQAAVERLYDHTIEELGPYLGVSEGFNALDGD
jgi:predicted lipoprotein